MPATLIQPIASDDVADIMAEVALASPRNGMIEISGPERLRMSDLLTRYLTATGDKRPVEASPEALYFGVKLDEVGARFAQQSAPRKDQLRPVVRIARRSCLTGAQREDRSTNAVISRGSQMTSEPRNAVGVVFVSRQCTRRSSGNLGRRQRPRRRCQWPAFQSQPRL